MREATIARNYAETLLELARRASNLEGWGQRIDDVADAMQRDRAVWLFLESPRISSAEKNRVLLKALSGQLPPTFVRFLQALVNHRRQMLIPVIAREYHDLVDAIEGRIHANVVVARAVDEAERNAIAERLSAVLGKRVVPHMAVNPAILGGVVVRVGDTVFDGSVRKRLSVLRNRMTTGR